MLVIIIVSWNVRSLLERCLESVLAHGVSSIPQHILVVDNASIDGTVDMVRSRFKSIEVIESTKNLGFTGGNNLGLMRASELLPDANATEDYVMLLNPDTVIAPGALDLGLSPHNTLLANG